MGIVFGGAMMSQVDLAAATHARMLLYWSDCNKAVTHKNNNEFTAEAFAGDTIKFVSKVVEVRNNAIKFEVMAYRNPLPTTEKPCAIIFEEIGKHWLVFVTKTNDKFTPHHLKDIYEAQVAENEAEAVRAGYGVR